MSGDFLNFLGNLIRGLGTSVSLTVSLTSAMPTSNVSTLNVSTLKMSTLKVPTSGMPIPFLAEVF